MRKPCILIALILLAVCSVSEASSDEEKLTTLLHEFMAGASENSAASHDRFWAGELVYTSSAGERFGKAEIMNGFDGDAEPEEEEPATVYTAEDIRTQLYGETAVVTFRLVGTTQAVPPVVSQYFNTGTFLKRDDSWQAVAWQATRIPDPQ